MEFFPLIIGTSSNGTIVALTPSLAQEQDEFAQAFFASLWRLSGRPLRFSIDLILGSDHETSGQVSSTSSYLRKLCFLTSVMI
jgi:hypothetical protein